MSNISENFLAIKIQFKKISYTFTNGGGAVPILVHKILVLCQWLCLLTTYRTFVVKSPTFKLCFLNFRDIINEQLSSVDWDNELVGANTDTSVYLFYTLLYALDKFIPKILFKIMNILYGIERLKSECLRKSRNDKQVKNVTWARQILNIWKR